MRLSAHAINEIAGNLDTRENFRGAAWWLMNRAGGDEGEIWDAVTRFRYSDADLPNYPATERAWAIYVAI